MSPSKQFPLVIDTYRAMVLSSIKNRKFATYDQVKSLDEFVVWRHDCDMSLNRAKFISSLDAELGIKSTFFVNLHSSFYNIFELSQTKLIREIVGDGHRIGLHFDFEYFEKTCGATALSDVLFRESQMLEHVAESSVNVFSFHNPNKLTSSYSEFEYGGLINCYSTWMLENLHYSSDSNGYWRHQPIPEVLQDKTILRLQILTHPEWWLTKVSTPRDRVLRCAYGRAKKTIEEYDIAVVDSTNQMNVNLTDKESRDFDRASKIL